MDIGNLISALMALNEMGDRARLGAALFHLGRFFSYIQEGGTQVSLLEERRFLEHFLELEALRFDGRLSFSIQVEKDIEEVRITRCSLLPALTTRLERRLERSSGPVVVDVEFRAHGTGDSAGLAVTVALTEKKPAGTFRRAIERKKGDSLGF